MRHTDVTQCILGAIVAMPTNVFTKTPHHQIVVVPLQLAPQTEMQMMPNIHKYTERVRTKFRQKLDDCFFEHNTVCHNTVTFEA